LFAFAAPRFMLVFGGKLRLAETRLDRFFPLAKFAAPRYHESKQHVMTLANISPTFPRSSLRSERSKENLKMQQAGGELWLPRSIKFIVWKRRNKLRLKLAWRFGFFNSFSLHVSAPNVS
jgi:hypothetical protein